MSVTHPRSSPCRPLFVEVRPASFFPGVGAVCPRMASSSTSAAASSEPIEVPPLPSKLRPKPQRKGNIGVGRLYADEAAFLADVEQWKQEQMARAEQVKERERAQERVRERGRDRSERQRDAEDNPRRVKHCRAAARTPMAPSASSQSRLLYENLMDPGDLDLRELRGWSCVWSQEVPPLVMDHEPIAEKHDDWWQRLD